ncbi:MAG: RNA polymerase sigma factor [Fusicatenibacter sp.]|nr:sigma-70 family RNA polymerase sigma factor [Fusicatenibacter sp.]
MKRSEFDRVYKENTAFTYREALYETKNAALAEDITQEVFLKLYINIEDIREDEVKSWLRTVAKNTARSYFRKAAHYQETNLDDLVDFLIKEEDLSDPGNKQNHSEFEEKVMDALYEYNKEWYYLIREIKIKKRSYNEVAAELGISRNNLGVKLHRAKDWLIANFGKEAKDMGIL